MHTRASPTTRAVSASVLPTTPSEVDWVQRQETTDCAMRMMNVFRRQLVRGSYSGRRCVTFGRPTTDPG